MGDNITSNVTTTSPVEVDQQMQTALLVFEVINITLLVIACWVLTCVIVYGTKTSRWTKKPGSSSLSSGMIYTACAVSILFIITRLATTEAIFRIPLMDIDNGSGLCETLGDATIVTFTVASYSVYLFLCIRQRLIYTHPYVREKVGKCMDWFSRLFFIVLTGVCIAIMCSFAVPNEVYANSANGCVEDRNPKNTIYFSVALIASQFTILGLSIYPAVRVRFPAKIDREIPPIESPDTDPDSDGESTSAATSSCCMWFLSASTDVATSPVQMSVRRTVINTVIIVFTDIITLGIEALGLPWAPLALRQTTKNISLLINVFCMLATFGFAGRILTLFCPRCKRRTSHEVRIEICRPETQV